MAAIFWIVIAFITLKHVQCQYFDLFQNFNRKNPASRLDDVIVFPEENSFFNKPLDEGSRHRPRNKQPIKIKEDSSTSHVVDRNDNNNNVFKRKMTTKDNSYSYTTVRNFRTTRKDSSHTGYSPKEKYENIRTDSDRNIKGDSNINRRWPSDNNNNNANHEEGTWGYNVAKPNFVTRPDNLDNRPYNGLNKRQYTTTQSNFYATEHDHDTDKILSHQNVNADDSLIYYPTPTIRPGVRPANIDPNKPPITNKPPSSYENLNENDGSMYSGDSGVDPKVSKGVDPDNMRSAEKRKYMELAERMCDSYKALSVKKIEAIPLLPSPESVAININVSACRPANVPLVVGGRAVTIKEFPHMALLGWSKKGGGYSWKCGGSLVSKNFVLTAAHCTFYDKDDTVVSFIPRVVQLGSSYRDDGSALIVGVESITQHPKYMRRRTYYDIALLKLANPVKFSDTVKPACIGESPRPGEPVIATGWGRTESAPMSLELRSVSVTVWDVSECRKVLGSSLRTPEGLMADNQMCAGEKNGGKDTCVGDSGGPAQIQDGCTWRIVAVTSGGKSCGAPQTPAWYAIFNKAFIAAEVFRTDEHDKTYKDIEEHYTGVIDQDDNKDYNKRDENIGEEYVDGDKTANDYKRSVENGDNINGNEEIDVNIDRDNVNNNNRLNKHKYDNNYRTSDTGDMNRSYEINLNNRNRFDNKEVISDFDNSKARYESETDRFNTNSRNKFNNDRNNGWH